jgi:hypothetical protein
VEQEAAEIVGEVGEADLRLGACGSDGTNEQAHPVFLRGVREAGPAQDMLDAGADGGFSRISLSAASAAPSASCDGYARRVLDPEAKSRWSASGRRYRPRHRRPYCPVSPPRATPIRLCARTSLRVRWARGATSAARSSPKVRRRQSCRKTAAERSSRRTRQPSREDQRVGADNTHGQRLSGDGSQHSAPRHGGSAPKSSDHRNPSLAHARHAIPEQKAVPLSILHRVSIRA